MRKSRDPAIVIALATVRRSCTAFGRAIAVASLIVLVSAAAQGENVICDYTADTVHYYCRGWRDGVGPNGTRARFIAHMFGEAYQDDFARQVVPLGDINSDGHADFMVWVPGKCEWRVYLGDTLISKVPFMVWPKGAPPYPCAPFPGNFALLDDISGDGQPDLFRFHRAHLKIVEIYFAGTAFDTLPDLVLSRPEFYSLGIPGAVSGGLDINGDGQPDFALGDPSYISFAPKEYGRLYLFWAGTALDSTPDLIFTDTFWVGQNKPQPVGGPIALFPSLNADPYADLVIGRASENLTSKDPPGRIQVHFGGPLMDTVPDMIFECPDTASDPDYGPLVANYFGGIAVNVGDVNLDGWEDLLVSGWQVVPSYVYYGGPSFDGVVDLRLSGPGWGTKGQCEFAVGLGDVNADGHRDFATVYWADPNLVYDGHVHIHFPRSDNSGAADWVISGDDWYFTSEGFGRETKSLGDVDGDGIEDFAVSTMNDNVDQFNLGALFIFAGCSCDIYTGVHGPDDGGGARAPAAQIRLVSQNPTSGSVVAHLADSFDHGTVVVYDILGRRARTLLDGQSPPDRHVVWDGCDSNGRPVPSGLYFLRAVSRSRSQTVKVVILK